MVDLAPPWAKEAARRGVELAEESLAEMKRHNAIVEKLLLDIAENRDYSRRADGVVYWPSTRTIMEP